MMAPVLASDVVLGAAMEGTSVEHDSAMQETTSGMLHSAVWTP